MSRRGGVNKRCEVLKPEPASDPSIMLQSRFFEFWQTSLEIDIHSIYRSSTIVFADNISGLTVQLFCAKILFCFLSD